MGERLLCTQEVGGSIPPGSTMWFQAPGCNQEIFNDSVRFSGIAKCKPGGRVGKMARIAGHLLFNNMVVLSRAFWVQDGYGEIRVLPIIEMNTKNVSAKQVQIVVSVFGVSPVEA